MAKKKFLFDFTKFATTKLISAVIADLAPQNIVCTFTSIKPFKGAVYGDFSVTGTAKTVDSCTLSGNIVTVHVTEAYVFGNTCSLVYDTSKAKGDTITIPVDNLVAE